MTRGKLIWQAIVVIAALVFTVWAMYRPGGIVERVSVPPSTTSG
ncbi:MAG TPA: hypothetical protein VHL55_07180 [Acidimicrobiia bacterium]|nr:hypothetical protein [Acidimicrobiia bacterium]